MLKRVTVESIAAELDMTPEARAKLVALVDEADGWRRPRPPMRFNAIGELWRYLASEYLLTGYVVMLILFAACVVVSSSHLEWVRWAIIPITALLIAWSLSYEGPYEYLLRQRRIEERRNT